MDEYDKLKLQVESKLRDLVKNKCKTLENFANEFGCDVRTASRWVNNGIDSVYKLYEICAFFNLKLEIKMIVGDNDNETL